MDSSARFIPRVMAYVSWLTYRGSRIVARYTQCKLDARRKKLSAPLGLPIAAAPARRGLALPGSTTTAARKATGADRALLSALHGGRHAAALIDRAGQLDAGCAVVDHAP